MLYTNNFIYIVAFKHFSCSKVLSVCTQLSGDESEPEPYGAKSFNITTSNQLNRNLLRRRFAVRQNHLTHCSIILHNLKELYFVPINKKIVLQIFCETNFSFVIVVCCAHSPLLIVLMVLTRE